MDFTTYKASEAKLYGFFKEDAVTVPSEGVIVSPALVNRDAGYVIGIRYDNEVNDGVAAFAERIKAVTPSFAYIPDLVHTTLKLTGVTKNQDFVPEQIKLDALSDIVSAIFPAAYHTIPQTTLDTWLYNKDCTILAGDADERFANIVSLIETTNDEHVKYELAGPKMAHITANRFMQERKGEELTAYLALMKEAPRFGKRAAKSIFSGYFTCDMDHGFRLSTTNSFNLQA